MEGRVRLGFTRPASPPFAYPSAGLSPSGASFRRFETRYAAPFAQRRRRRWGAATDRGRAEAPRQIRCGADPGVARHQASGNRLERRIYVPRKTLPIAFKNRQRDHRRALVRATFFRSAQLLRCAIYTRKSSEEGLEQDFNSLHAQREACEAFIKSQTGEGWRLLNTHYDDGGLSGATMDRPGLQNLLEDIRQKLVDVVVVYKVDRLTRSLSDFARMVEVFDAHGVSFVAVTQQFNTTTSMGRLTLNVLLSFAQFERR